MNSIYLLTSLSVGFALCFLVGDPPNKFHPVAWLGKFVNLIVYKLKYPRDSKIEKLNGAIFVIILTTGICILSQQFILHLYSFFGLIGFTIYAIIVIKTTVAIMTLERHANIIILSLEKNDLQGARKNLSRIVSRNTNSLDVQHIMSGTIESIGESIVDAIISPLFYYTIFGPSGALGYRIVNTLDSMIGYKDKFYADIGWMTAKADTVLNFIPARLSAILMIFSAKLVGADWKNSIHVLSKDHARTCSVNAGYPMSTMAGALRIKLEKIDEYTLGTDIEKLSIEKCRCAIKIMQVTALLFYTLVAIPVILILSMIGWWNIFFGL